MVPPGFSAPERSAASIIRSAIRSFTEPPGLKYSTLARTVAWSPLVTLFSFTSGVFPTRSTMDSAYFMRGVSASFEDRVFTVVTSLRAINLRRSASPELAAVLAGGSGHAVAGRRRGNVAATADILQ